MRINIKKKCFSYMKTNVNNDDQQFHQHIT